MDYLYNINDLKYYFNKLFSLDKTIVLDHSERYVFVRRTLKHLNGKSFKLIRTELNMFDKTEHYQYIQIKRVTYVNNYHHGELYISYIDASKGYHTQDIQLQYNEISRLKGCEISSDEFNKIISLFVIPKI